jgi:aminopeptidase N
VRSAALGCATPAEVPFTHDGKRVAVTLPSAGGAGPLPAAPGIAPPSDTVCVTLRYAGSPADGLVITTDSAGRWRAFGDNWPDRARHWLATVDHPSDKALVEFVVDAPVAMTVVSNGSRRSEASLGGRKRSTWGSTVPLPTYLMVIAAAPLTETKLGDSACGLASMGRCVPQSVFTAPEQAGAMPGNFARAGDIVEFFARTVGPFPYEQLAHLQSSTRFGGMENAGAIFYADRLFRTPAGVGVGLIAHETAHQWFGDAVTEREWGHLWLSEGFATYFAALYTEHAFGDSTFRAEMARIRGQVTGAAIVAQRPVIDTAQTDLMQLLNANSYQKGGFVLHMLRREVGDSAFFAGVRAYYANGTHGTAVTTDLRREVERAAGRDLGWFFDQWLRRPGFAEVTLSWRHDAATEGLIVVVEQGMRFRPYRFPLTLELEDATGEKSVVQLQVPAQGRAEIQVRQKVSRPPRAVRPDPRGDLLAVIRIP